MKLRLFKALFFTALGFTLGAISAMPRRNVVPNRPYALIVSKLQHVDVLACQHDDNCYDIHDIDEFAFDLQNCQIVNTQKESVK